MISQCCAGGGTATTSIAVAFAYAYTSGKTSFAEAFAEAITVTVDKYGCETIITVIAGAQHEEDCTGAVASHE